MEGRKILHFGGTNTIFVDCTMCIEYVRKVDKCNFFCALLNCLFYPNIATINYRHNHQEKKKIFFTKNKANKNIRDFTQNNREKSNIVIAIFGKIYNLHDR